MPDIRDFFKEGRPIVEQQRALSKRSADIGKRARDVGIEWGQIKAVLKAQIDDEEDGGDRLKKLVEKNEAGVAYAEIATKVNNETLSVIQGGKDENLDVREFDGGVLRRKA